MSDFAHAADYAGLLFIACRTEIATGSDRHYGLPDVYDDVVAWAEREQQAVDPDCSVYRFHPSLYF